MHCIKYELNSRRIRKKRSFAMSKIIEIKLLTQNY